MGDSEVKAKDGNSIAGKLIWIMVGVIIGIVASFGVVALGIGGATKNLENNAPTQVESSQDAGSDANNAEAPADDKPAEEPTEK